MAGITASGLGSGIDVNGIVSQLVSIERRPIVKLQGQRVELQTKLSTVGQFKSMAAELQKTAKTLATASTYEGMSAASSDTSFFTASVASVGAKPAVGVYSVNISALAAGQSVVSASGQFSDPTKKPGAGTLKVTLGQWTGTTFTQKSETTPVDVTITADDTLATVRDKINAASAGVTATLITDTTGTRLSLQSSSTGAVNGFRITTVDDDGNHGDAAGLSRLAYDPQNGINQMSLTASSADAVATVNGIEVKSSSNTFNGVVQGLNIVAKKVTTSGVGLTVTRNSGAAQNAVNAFVKAYNDLVDLIKEQTKYDPEKKEAALFQGNNLIVGINNQLKALTGQVTTASSTFSTLTSMGIELQRDGKLQVNSANLDKATANLDELKKAMTSTSTAANALGLATRFQKLTDTLLGESNGTFTNISKSFNAKLTENQKQQQKIEDSAVRTEKRLRAQYSTLDQTASKYNAIGAQVTQQIALMTGANNSK